MTENALPKQQAGAQNIMPKQQAAAENAMPKLKAAAENAMPGQKGAMELPEITEFCKKHMYRYALARTKDGWCCDGFIEHIDKDFVYMAVPAPMQGQRGFYPFYPGYGPFYGPFYGQFGAPLYPYPYFPRRRFVRQVFPLAALLALSLLPFY